MEPGPYVLLSISDTGFGMSEETRSRIFEPFFTTKELGKGMGLGLATVYGIVKQNNGFIWVYSELGQGTTFKICLPRAQGSISDSKKDQASPERLCGQETILLVEDDSQLRNMTKTILERYGYQVMEAENGKSALDLFKERQKPVQLLITDVIMPGMNGKVLAEYMQSLQPGVKVLFMSGYTNNTIAHHWVLDSSFPFIEKPFTSDSLLRRLRSLLDEE